MEGKRGNKAIRIASGIATGGLMYVLLFVKGSQRLFIAAAAGALTYVALYLGKGFIEDVFFLRTEVATALIDVQVKAVTSLFNAVIAVVASVPLAVALKSGLRRAGLSRWLGAEN